MFYCLSCVVRSDILLSPVIWDGKSLLEAYICIKDFPAQRDPEYLIVMTVNSRHTYKNKQCWNHCFKLSVLIGLVEKEYMCRKKISLNLLRQCAYISLESLYSFLKFNILLIVWNQIVPANFTTFINTLIWIGFSGKLTPSKLFCSVWKQVLLQ